MIGFGSGLAPTLISTVVSHANPFIKLPPIFALLVATLFFAATSFAQLTPPKLDIPYGHNSAAGKFAEVNGINLYYETYGSSRPMLQIHGNGDSIAGMGHQIKFFSTHYRVIAADSRGHGKSELGAGRLTYEQIAEDLNALLDQLGKQPNIPDSDVRKITAPVLVMAGDKDVIKAEHSLEIFQNLAKAHLCIFPGSTHMIAWENPALLNQTMETFFSKPYTRPDTRDIFQ